MSPLKSPLTCNHVPAQPGWFAVFPVELPNDGGIDLTKEPVLAWRMETFEIDQSRSRFDGVTPVLAGGSIGEASVYALQFGQSYYTGDERFDTKQELVEYFRKCLAQERKPTSPRTTP
jgi:hypothetical protein